MFLETLRKLQAHHLIWFIAILVTAKAAYKQLYPPPRIEVDVEARPIPTSYEEAPQFIDTVALFSDAPTATFQMMDTSLLYRFRKSYYFSTAIHTDVFELSLRGSSVLKAKATFTIRRVNGDILYTDSGAATSLAANDADDIVVQERQIIENAQHFLDADNYISPAVHDDEEFDRAVNIDRELFQELHWNDLIAGFSYISLKNPTKRVKIAFSRQRNKMVVYYICC